MVRVEDWKNRVKGTLSDSDAEVTALSPAEFARAVKALSDRVQFAKAGSMWPAEDAASPFDTADVLVLDSDLTPDPSSDSGDDPDGDVDKYLVGEVGQAVARLARAHSRVGAIVVVNQTVKHRTFDLTMARWTSGSADVHITHDDVDSEGLWRGAGTAEYRPWAWPILGRVAGATGSFMETVRLDTAVLQALDLIRNDEPTVTFRQLEALTSDVDDPLAITIRDVALSPALGIGVRPKDHEADDQLLRVGVWGVRRWLDRVVVPTQSVLIDLPHLLQDRPWHALSRDDLSVWNSDARLWASDPIDLFASACNRPATHLLSRPVWNVADLPAEYSVHHRVRPGDPVFCEDTSKFALSSDAIDFKSDLEGPFSTRYVQKLSDVDYTPKHRLFQ